MLWKLLRHNISVWQLFGYTVASLAGFAIILIAIAFYRDVHEALSPGSSEGGVGLISSRNIVISKPVSLSSTLTGETPSFSEEEINEILGKPWAGGVAPFQAADFDVHAGIEFGDRSMHTALFLESVPDSLLEINSSIWRFDSLSPEVPIIISKDYLALYNFGFAASGRMPMVSEGMLSAVPLRLTLSGRGQREVLPARIVGYSSWLNTVAVPQVFMDWAHERFGRGDVSRPSRIVVQVSDPSDPSIDKFLDEKGYEQSGGDAGLGRATYFLKVLTTVIIGVGSVITLLAIGILVLSMFLLVQKNRRSILGLMLLGYSPNDISRCYIGLIIALNTTVLCVSSMILMMVAPLWREPLKEIGVSSVSIIPVLLGGVILIMSITLFNIYIVRNSIKRFFCVKLT